MNRKVPPGGQETLRPAGKRALWRLLGPRGYCRAAELYHRLIRKAPWTSGPKGGLVEQVRSATGVANLGSPRDIIPLLRRRARAPVPQEGCPLVSVIVLNRNGLAHLQRLFPSLRANTIYPHCEVILADNASKDRSCAYAEAFGLPSCRVVRFTENLSFSRANNLAAKEAAGDLLLFLNNDVEVCYGWLNELVYALLANPKAACVGGTLIYPRYTGREKEGEIVMPGLSVQHAGIAFRDEGGLMRAFNLGRYQSPLAMEGPPRPVPAVTAACVLWRRGPFWALGGFDEGYYYGYEDVDISLRAREAGHEVLYCPTSYAWHHEFGTQAQDPLPDRQERRRANYGRHTARWGKTLKGRYWEEKLFGTPFWAEYPLTIAITVTEFHPRTTCGDYFTATGLGNALESLGYRVVYLPRRPVEEWYEVPDAVDVLLCLMDDYDLSRLRCRPGVVKVAWVRNWVDRWLTRPWLCDYDMVLASSRTALEALGPLLGPGQARGVLRIAADPVLFRPMAPDPALASDICFAGNIFHVPRDIAAALRPEGRRFRFWGRLEAGPGHPFAEYHEGPVPYDRLPVIYSSAKIVLEDCTPMCRPWGCLNSRTFEAAACGACVISNAALEQEELFGGAVLVYRSPQELEDLISYYLSHEEERRALGERAREVVLSGHTYTHRAYGFRGHLARLFGLCAGIPQEMPARGEGGLKTF